MYKLQMTNIKEVSIWNSSMRLSASSIHYNPSAAVIMAWRWGGSEIKPQQKWYKNKMNKQIKLFIWQSCRRLCFSLVIQNPFFSNEKCKTGDCIADRHKEHCLPEPNLVLQLGDNCRKRQNLVDILRFGSPRKGCFTAARMLLNATRQILLEFHLSMSQNIHNTTFHSRNLKRNQSILQDTRILVEELIEQCNSASFEHKSSL